MLAKARHIAYHAGAGLAHNCCTSMYIGGKAMREKKVKIKIKKNPRGKKKFTSHLAGLEPATFRLTAERANRLRHKCKSVATHEKRII